MTGKRLITRPLSARRASGLAILAAIFVALVPSANAEVVDIDNRKLAELLAKGVPVVDVRTPGEWQQTGVIAGSHMLMFFDERGRYDLQKFEADITKLVKPEEPVIVICRTGSRTVSIAPFLDQKVGYPVVYNVRLGIKGWIASGGKTSAVKTSSTLS